MAATTQINRDAILGARIVIAALVAALTFLGWLMLWGIEGSLHGLFTHHEPTIAERFGIIWQFILAGLAVGLIGALFISPGWSRRFAAAWFAALIALAVDGHLVFGPLDVWWLPMLLIVLAGGLLVWVNHVARRAA
jgi:hypothetical protein